MDIGPASTRVVFAENRRLCHKGTDPWDLEKQHEIDYRTVFTQLGGNALITFHWVSWEKKSTINTNKDRHTKVAFGSMSNQYHTIVQGIRWISNRIDGFFYVSAIIITRDQQSYPGRRYPRRDVTLITSFFDFILDILTSYSTFRLHTRYFDFILDFLTSYSTFRLHTRLLDFILDF